MTPVRAGDLRSFAERGHEDDSSCRFVRASDHNAQHPQCVENVTKEPNAVEFRSGYRGVSWNRRMKAWLAFWSEGKNRRSKTFNAKVMGFDKARAAAIDFLKKKKQLLQQLDPTYSDSCNAMGGADDDDFGEGGSMADSATTTSDSPNSSEINCCTVCGGGQVDSPSQVSLGLLGPTDDCCCGSRSLVIGSNLQ